MHFAVPGRIGDVAVALIGCAPSTGTSLISLHLARLIRDGGGPVTLVDGDVHGTSTWPPAGRGPYHVDCLAELLDDSTRLSQANLLDRGGIAMIPARSQDTAVNNRAYLGAPVLQTVIEHLRQSGVVILDLPSVSAEARAAAKRADGVVIVVEAGRTTVDQLTDAASSLRSVGVNVIGAVLNRS